MKDKFEVESLRLAKVLYGIGFNKESKFTNGTESWLFERSDELQEVLSFYFMIRKKLENKDKI